MKFRKKPVEIEAFQWFKNGDHPEDGVGEMVTPVPGDGPAYARVEGQVVRFYRRPDVPGAQPHHADCQFAMDDHGWVDTLEDGHMVCPGDWIITGVKGERYPYRAKWTCKPDIFEMTYDPSVATTNVGQHREALEDFLGGWMLLPPLVRASAGVHLVEALENWFTSAGSQAVKHNTRGLKRRSRVTALFGLAYGKLSDLSKRLVNLADDEAERDEIDSDVRYQADMDPLGAIWHRKESLLPGKRWAPKPSQVEAEVLKGAAKDVVAEIGIWRTLKEKIHKEVLDELKKNAET